MRRILTAAAALVAATAAAQPQEQRLHVRIFAQVVSLPLPPGFVPLSDSAQPEFYIFEAVPEGETAESWTRMLTVTGHRGLAAKVNDPMAIADLFADRMRPHCQSGFVADLLSRGSDTATLHIGCGRVAVVGPERSETLLLRVLVGREDIYTLQMAQRRPAQDAPPSAADPMTTLHLFGAVRLCDPAPGERAPYPSCALP